VIPAGFALMEPAFPADATAWLWGHQYGDFIMT
jgi:hypothetical protein